MGTIVYRASKAQAVEDELRKIASHATLIAHRVIGNRLWFLAQHPAGRDADIAGLKWIGLTLIDCRNGEAAIKSMDETCGPCYYDCPLSFIERADPPVGEHAGPWREKVRAFHAKRSARRTLFREGSRLEYGNGSYVLRACLGRCGWNVRRESDGQTFRMKARQLAAATVLSSPAAQATSQQNPPAEQARRNS